jgi:hypothetical protein
VKATIVGGVPEQALRTSLAERIPGDHEMRTVAGKAWAALPLGVGSAQLVGLQESLAVELTVVEVEMAAGMRGGDLSARTYSLPDATEEDLTDLARETLDAWLAAAQGKSFDEDVAARELAFDLIAVDEPAVPARGDVDPLAAWATALITKLVADGSVEMRSSHWPVAVLAASFRDLAPDALEDGQARMDLGAHLLDALIESTAVEEVFVDGDALVAAAIATRPDR